MGRVPILLPDMTKDFFQRLLPEIDRYYDRHRPNYTRAQWHDAWLKADGLDMEVGEEGYTAWFVREYGEDKEQHARILAFNIRDELFSAEELYHRIRFYAVNDEMLDDMLNKR